MKLYITEDGKYVGTKAEAGKMGTPEEVPVDKPGLLRYLNALVEVMSDFTAAAPEPQPAPAFLSPERVDPLHFDDEWERMPLARQAHFAALFCEEARTKLGTGGPAKAAQGYKGKPRKAPQGYDEAEVFGEPGEMAAIAAYEPDEEDSDD